MIYNGHASCWTGRGPIFTTFIGELSRNKSLKSGLGKIVAEALAKNRPSATRLLLTGKRSNLQVS